MENRPQEEAAGNNRKPGAVHTSKRVKDALLIECLRDLSFIVFGILLPIYFLLYDRPPEFSVQIAAIRGLDMPPDPGSSSSISTAFNVTLHAGNRRATGRCYHNGEALVIYDGFTIAAGRVPGFCVPGKGDGEIRFLVSADGGVGLPEHVRDRMALERRVGAAQLDVEVKLFRRDDGSDRSMWIWCGLRMDETTTQPPSVTPCTVLGLQNWLSMNLY